MRITALVEAMVAAGATPDMILVAVRATEAANEHAMEVSRDKTRARVAKWREKKVGNVTDGAVTVTNGLRAGDARGEVKTSNSDIEPVEKKETPRAALEAVLDEARADAVIEHRQRLRKPLTAHAAKLLAGKFAQCPDPNAAADKMIGNGWQGFEPEWMNRPDARGSPPSKPLNASEILKARRQVNPDDDRPPNRPVLIASR